MKALLRLFFGGALNRVFDFLDRRIESDDLRNEVKGEVIVEYYRSRGDWMRSGGFLLCLIFALPLGFWFASVCVYSVFWCAGCAYPQTWTIAALPAPLDAWSGLIITSIFGVVGLASIRKER